MLSSIKKGSDENDHAPCYNSMMSPRTGRSSRRLSLIGSSEGDGQFSRSLKVTTVSSGESNGMILSQEPAMIPLEAANQQPELAAVPVLDHPQYTGCRYDVLKPPYSYAELITQAIMAAPHHRLTLSMIYQSIMDKYPYYRSKNSGWQNSIRHNLSLNKCFERIERSGEKSKGAWWTVRSEFMEVLEGGLVAKPVPTGSRKKKSGSASVAKCILPEALAQPPVHFQPKQQLEPTTSIASRPTPRSPINKLQIKFSLESLYKEAMLEDEEQAELECLCCTLQSIHSTSHPDLHSSI